MGVHGIYIIFMFSGLPEEGGSAARKYYSDVQYGYCILQLLHTKLSQLR